MKVDQINMDTKSAKDKNETQEMAKDKAHSPSGSKQSSQTKHICNEHST